MSDDVNKTTETSATDTTSETKDLKATTSTIVRTICLALALANQLLVASGFKALPISDDQVNVLVSTLITVGVSVWAWWKNNSFTKPAIKADTVMKDLKNG